MDDEKPCCANEALRRVKTIRINGIPTGIAMLEKIFDEVRNLDIKDDALLKKVLLEKAKVYNYIPKGASDGYTEALFREYRNVRRT